MWFQLLSFSSTCFPNLLLEQSSSLVDRVLLAVVGVHLSYTKEKLSQEVSRIQARTRAGCLIVLHFPGILFHFSIANELAKRVQLHSSVTIGNS